MIAFSTESLYSGCHFKVARVSLKYSVEKPDDPHKTVIVKLLYWDKPLLQRLMLYSKYLINSPDREVMYLNSYRIESYFYKGQMDFLKGFHTAEIYYNLEDVFNNRFGMVLQDLSKNDDGQPHGFSFDDAKKILSSLAEFHVHNYQKTLGNNLIGWNYAGYWTGNKREATKNTVNTSWERVKINFPEFHYHDRMPFLGGLLYDKLKYMENEFNELSSKKYRTLCHGDFKISNLFLKREPTSNHPEGKVYVIDFQWFGQGNGLIDAVYFLYTSLHVDHLSRIHELLSFYYHSLLNLGIKDYPEELFFHQADVILADFCVYCICSKYSNMTATDIKQYELKVKDGLHLRSIPHMQLILQKTHSIVHEWSKRPSQAISRKKKKV